MAYWLQRGSMRMKNVSVLVSLVALVSNVSAWADTHYVRPVNPGAAAPYTNWANASTNIQLAVDQAANGDVVLLTNGTYDVWSEILISNAKTVTVTSVNGAEVTIVDGGFPSRTNRCFHLNGNTPGAVLDGLTIRHGGASGTTQGGGVSCRGGGIVQNCIITENSAENSGGGIACDGSVSLIVNCLIAFNTATNGSNNRAGGGVSLSGWATARGCLIVSNSARFGGGVHIDSGNGGLVDNCTISGNDAQNGGGASVGSGLLRNTIIYFNTTPNPQKDIADDHGTPVGIFTNCCSSGISGGGNTNGNPLFVNGFCLAAGSPCIDRGTNQSWMVGAIDLAGIPRIINGSVDMGAYEYGSAAPTKIIGLSGSLAFGNVTTGTTATATLTITNSGNATLTVTDITYPAGFTGPWSGTIAAGESHGVTVSFSPVVLTTYSGTVTVNSDAAGGTATISVFGTGATAEMPPGEGTEADPYRISQLSHFVWMGDHVGFSAGKYHVLQNDMDASDTTNWNSGAGFAPIGTVSTPFEGLFDGNGRVISNLRINRPGQNNVGLFGWVQGGTAVVKNLGLAGCTVVGKDYVGSLVGYNCWGTVEDCYATGAVTGTGMAEAVGGLLGITAGPVRRCYTMVAVTGTGNCYVGGLVGYNYFSAVSECYATGAVTGNSSVGGLLGENCGGAVDRCYAIGAVTGNSSVGGLVGLNGGTVNDSYWDTNITGQASSSGGTGVSTVQMKQQDTFTAWDFTNVWRIAENRTSPLLLWQDYILEVSSLFGAPYPEVGTHTYSHGILLTNSVSTPASQGGTQRVCTGWTMIGNAPTSGSATNFSMTLTNDATLTWQWQTNYWLEVDLDNSGALGPASGWYPAGSTQIVSYVLTGPGAIAVNTAASFGSLAPDALCVGVVSNTVHLSIQLETSPDLVPTTWTNAGPPVEWFMPAETNKAFYRVGIRE